MVKYKIKIPKLTQKKIFKFLGKNNILVEKNDITLQLININMHQNDSCNKTFIDFEKKILDEFSMLKSHREKIKFMFNKFVVINNELYIEYLPNSTAILFMAFIHSLCDFINKPTINTSTTQKLYAKIGVMKNNNSVESLLCEDASFNMKY